MATFLLAEKFGLRINSSYILPPREQCFDSASNMSRKYSGVQTQLRELESRTLFVHCSAHNGNLVAQDAMKNVNMINDSWNSQRCHQLHSRLSKTNRSI